MKIEGVLLKILERRVILKIFFGEENRFGEYTGKDIFGTRDLEKIFR